MQNIKFIAIFLLFIAPKIALATDPVLSFYVFENKGKASNGKVVLENKDNNIPINVPWFEWKCTAQKQIDGALLNCKRNGDFVETKIYCNLPQKTFAELVRVGKDQSFVTFEVRCSPPEQPKKKTKAKAKPEEAPKT